MPKDIFPQTTPEIAARRRQLAPDIHDAFTSFSERVFAAGAGSFGPPNRYGPIGPAQYRIREGRQPMLRR